MAMGRVQLALGSYRSLREVVFHTLRQAILSGDLPAGAPLVETELAKEMGISTTPLREALRMLELEGLVLSIPHRGTFVTKLSEADLRDACEVRAALEGMAGFCAASKITPEQLTELRSLLTQAEACIVARDYQTTYRTNARFHHLIWEAGGNRRLIGLLEMMVDLIRAISLRVFKVEGQPEINWRQHMEILRALESRGPERTQQLLFEHILSMVPLVSEVGDPEQPE